MDRIMLPDMGLNSRLGRRGAPDDLEFGVERENVGSSGVVSLLEVMLQYLPVRPGNRGGVIQEE